MPAKSALIEGLHKIMCTATSTATDARVTNNDYFKRRVLGFKAEIEFENFVRSKKLTFLEGGSFISKKLDGALSTRNNFIYVTVSADDPRKYTGIYATIARWSEVSELLYVQITDADWGNTTLTIKTTKRSKKTQTTIPLPTYAFYRFRKKEGVFELHPSQDFAAVTSGFNAPAKTPSVFHLRKREQFNFFSGYEQSILAKIYATRYMLDVILRQAQGRQIIDIDGFLDINGKFTLVEIKEKTPIKKKGTKDSPNNIDWRYGWDTRRILWYLYLQKHLPVSVLYNVRQITDRTARAFVQWDSIFLDDFLCGVSWSNVRGGGGGEDTLLAPYLFFVRLEDALIGL